MSVKLALVSAGSSLGVALLLSQGAAAQASKPRPKISKDSAQAVASAQVPNGKVAAGEYEHEKGRWIWSFEFKVPGKTGIDEVNVDAMTGNIVSREHESPKAEARENKAERRTGKP